MKKIRKEGKLCKLVVITTKPIRIKAGNRVESVDDPRNIPQNSQYQANTKLHLWKNWIADEFPKSDENWCLIVTSKINLPSSSHGGGKRREEGARLRVGSRRRLHNKTYPFYQSPFQFRARERERSVWFETWTWRDDCRVVMGWILIVSKFKTWQ